jgi:hypothetical protein
LSTCRTRRPHSPCFATPRNFLPNQSRVTTLAKKKTRTALVLKSCQWSCQWSCQRHNSRTANLHTRC